MGRPTKRPANILNLVQSQPPVWLSWAGLGLGWAGLGLGWAGLTWGWAGLGWVWAELSNSYLSVFPTLFGGISQSVLYYMVFPS